MTSPKAGLPRGWKEEVAKSSVQITKSSEATISAHCKLAKHFDKCTSNQRKETTAIWTGTGACVPGAAPPCSLLSQWAAPIWQAKAYVTSSFPNRMKAGKPTVVIDAVSTKEQAGDWSTGASCRVDRWAPGARVYATVTTATHMISTS